MSFATLDTRLLSLFCGRPLSVCLTRVNGREGGPDADSGAVEQIWQSFADIGEFEPNVLELGERTVDEATETLARRLEDGHLLI